MRIGSVAALYGVVFPASGVAGFVPGLSPEHVYPGIAVTGASRLAFGQFPVNVLNNLAHILFGVRGLIAARSIGGVWLHAVLAAIAAYFGFIHTDRVETR